MNYIMTKNNRFSESHAVFEHSIDSILATITRRRLERDLSTKISRNRV